MSDRLYHTWHTLRWPSRDVCEFFFVTVTSSLDTWRHLKGANFRALYLRNCTSDLVRPRYVGTPGSVIDEKWRSRADDVITSPCYMWRSLKGATRIRFRYFAMINSKRFLHMTERNTSVFVHKHISSFFFRCFAYSETPIVFVIFFFLFFFFFASLFSP